MKTVLLKGYEHLYCLDRRMISLPPGTLSLEVKCLDEKHIKVVLMAIELLRAELDQLVERSPNLTDEEVVKKSQELDRLLTEYYQLIKKKQKEQG